MGGGRLYRELRLLACHGLCLGNETPGITPLFGLTSFAKPPLDPNRCQKFPFL